MGSPTRKPPGGLVGVAGTIERVELAAAANATTLRVINEAIEEGRITADGSVAFVCECGRVGCDALVELSVEEYEAVRGDARRFFVEPGHELPGDVIDARHPRFVVATKRGSAAEEALRSDPRADRAVVQLRWTRSTAVPALSIELNAVLSSIRRVRHLVSAFAAEYGADRALLGRIAVAVSEATTNAVVHAYPPDQPGALHVSADVEDAEIEIVIADDGTGLRPASDSGGLGLGMPIIARCCDRFAVRERLPHGTEIWMGFAHAD
jgi:serine/threonine-protein kinase RsbW/stage II sporulation protein AB (anti-sigma F factor)